MIPKQGDEEHHIMRSIVVFGASLLSSLVMTTSALAATLIVEVRNIEAEGEMHLAIYDDPEVFENDRGDKGGAAPRIIDGVIEPVRSGTATYSFDLPDGVYAIGIFVDVNKNNEMDKNFLGIPQEQYGFSNNAKGTFGPPSFKEAAFTMSQDLRLEIDL